MRIAQVAPLIESVPPTGYGGTERVVHYLTEALVRRGHDVTLFASADSRTSARLVPCAPRALRLGGSLDPAPWLTAQLGAVLERARELDVVHAHVDHAAFLLARATTTPVVHTLHGRLDLPDLPAAFAAFPDAALVSISDAQRAPVARARWVATVHHGLPADLYRPSLARGGGHLLFLGRFSPEKRPHLAIEAATRAGVPIVLAAKADRADREYFETAVRPLLDRPGVRYVGEVDEAEKQRLLAGARALVLPIDWPEPFGLVFVEALACGTPVLACPAGAAPELLEHGRTAWLAEDLDGLVEGARAVADLDRAACRRAFEERFLDERMATDYERVYAALRETRPEPLEAVA